MPTAASWLVGEAAQSPRSGLSSRAVRDLLLGLDAWKSDGQTRLIAPSDTVLVGVKDFQPPGKKGRPWRCGLEGCYIMVLEADVAPDLRSYFPDSAVDTVSDQPIWRWTAPPVEGHPERYVSHIVQ